jgi:hypothetical protein
VCGLLGDATVAPGTLKHVALFGTVLVFSNQGVRLVYACKLAVRRGVQEGDLWSRILKVRA